MTKIRVFFGAGVLGPSWKVRARGLRKEEEESSQVPYGG